MATSINHNIIPIKCSELVTDINVNSSTNNPDKAWSILETKIEKKIVDPLPLDLPIYENKVRFVCLSDTHSKQTKMVHEIPSGDVLIHAGDFSNIGGIDDIKNFSEFLNNLNDKFKYKIVIAGNHELTFDKDAERTLIYYTRNFKNRVNRIIELDINPRDHLKNCIYLEDSMVELFGIKIYGSPWQPTFGDWAFNVDRGEKILKKWNQIPNDIDVLITHGPPLGFGDITKGNNHVGCCELLTTIQERVRPKYHIFGHIHEDNGIWTDGQTTFINPSICNFHYRPVNPPVIFDIELKSGIDKKSFF